MIKVGRPVVFSHNTYLGQVSKRISPNAVSYLVQTDPCPYVTYKSDSNSLVQHCKAAVDECRPLPYKTNTFDLVICNLNLHWANDLNGTLSEINRVLRPDAAIIGSIWANDSLYELRQALQLAELERRGGVGTGHHSTLQDVDYNYHNLINQKLLFLCFLRMTLIKETELDL